MNSMAAPLMIPSSGKSFISLRSCKKTSALKEQRILCVMPPPPLWCQARSRTATGQLIEGAAKEKQHRLGQHLPTCWRHLNGLSPRGIDQIFHPPAAAVLGPKGTTLAVSVGRAMAEFVLFHWDQYLTGSSQLFPLFHTELKPKDLLPPTPRSSRPVASFLSIISAAPEMCLHFTDNDDESWGPVRALPSTLGLGWKGAHS